MWSLWKTKMTQLTAVLVALAALTAPAAAKGHVKSSSCVVDDSDKFDCGYVGIDETGCSSNGALHADPLGRFLTALTLT